MLFKTSISILGVNLLAFCCGVHNIPMFLYIKELLLWVLYHIQSVNGNFID